MDITGDERRFRLATATRPDRGVLPTGVTRHAVAFGDWVALFSIFLEWTNYP